ncbi:MAG: hypothetical protein PHQ35_10815 [Phycisphaerae bacterium]|nr:hypothetical protein [Phycisphaerae bacterium]
MASGIYNRFKANLMNKVVDLEADDIYITLYDGSHAFTATDTDYTTDNELATAGGYTQGAVASNLLAGKAVTEGATTKWDATDHAWTAATFTAYHAVIWDATAGNDLICSFDFGGAKEVSAGTFTIVFNVAGIITLASA